VAGSYDETAARAFSVPHNVAAVEAKREKARTECLARARREKRLGPQAICPSRPAKGASNFSSASKSRSRGQRCGRHAGT